MNNKLFLVCPFSQMENFIKSRYGEDVFFLTSMAGIFNFRDKKYLQTVRNFIVREKIKEIIIVVETSCQFINNALRNRLHGGSSCENIIRMLLKDDDSTESNKNTVEEQQRRLAELIIQHQCGELMNPEFFQNLIIDNEIFIKGLITTKAIDSIVELPFPLINNPRGSLKL